MSTDHEILTLIDQNSVYWCKREGGSQAYQIHRTRLHQLVKDGLVLACEDGCCYREYYLTEKGRKILYGN